MAAEREGHALAVTGQRNAENIKNVTAVDSWGNMPNMSIGELAMRMPGVSWTTDDDNVVMNISIRGMSTDFTRLNIDGMSSTSVAGNGRGAKGSQRRRQLAHLLRLHARFNRGGHSPAQFAA